MRGARRYQDLIVWQLADQVRVLVFKLTERERFARDFKLHSQTEDALNSVCRNIAEGFGCKHKEFARFPRDLPPIVERVGRFVSHRATKKVCIRARLRTNLAVDTSAVSSLREIDSLSPDNP